MTTPFEEIPSISLQDSSERYKSMQLPDTDINFCVISNAREECLIKAILLNQKNLKEIGAFFESKGVAWKADLNTLLNEDEKEIEEYQLENEELKKIEKGCEELIEWNKQVEENSKVKVEQKKWEMTALEKTIEEVQKEVIELQDKVDEQIKKELPLIIEKISEQIVKELYAALLTQDQDPNLVKIAKHMVCLLKGEVEVDPLVVKTYLSHYQGLLIRLLSYIGLRMDREVGQNATKVAEAFIDENDTSIPKNESKKVLPQYLAIIPLANWIKCASSIADKQCSISDNNTLLSDKQIKKAVLSAEIGQLKISLEDAKLRSKETEDEIKALEDLKTDVYFKLYKYIVKK